MTAEKLTARDPQDLIEERQARLWYAAISPEKKKVIRDLHRLQPAWNLIVFLFIGMWVLGAAVLLREPSWPIRFLCYMTIGVAIQSMAILLHEGIHGNLFRRKKLDRWASVILGIPALFAGTAYKVPHILHHRFNRTEKDPDEFTNLSKNRTFLSIAFYAWGLIGMPLYLFHAPFNALRLGKPRERLDIILEYGLLGVIYGGVFLTAAKFGAVSTVLHCWIIPMAVSSVLGNVRGWAEHAMTPRGHPLTETRTVTSNWLVSLLMCNLNYHLEHHLFPGVPWYRLPRLHALLQDDYRRAGAYAYRSYLKFVWDAVRIGIHRLAPRVTDSSGAAG